jgi:dipeptidase D
MDMVAVGSDSSFDPLKDPIHPIRDDEKGTVTADGTSLGADDGAGVATIMTYLESGQDHGPLRVFVTTNEEDGMTGADNLNPQFFKDLKYLINVDAEESTSMCVSTASAIDIFAKKELTYVANSKNTAVKINLSGLKGGHSGMDIDKNRCNAIMELGYFINELVQINCDFDIVSFEGGEFSNSIPKNANLVLAIDKGSLDDIETLRDKNFIRIEEDYKKSEENISFTVESIDVPSKVMSQADEDDLIRLFPNIQNGIYTMSSDMEGLVESSCNLGKINLNESNGDMAFLLRSSSQEKEDELLDHQEDVLEMCDFTYEIEKGTKAWPYNPNNKLINIAKDVYKQQNDSELEIIAVHAGLECGAFATYNPNIMMCAIGPDILNVHSVDEVLYLNSVPKVYKLLSEMLLRVN